MTYAAVIPILSWVFMNAATCIILTVPLQHRLYFLPAFLIPATISFSTIQYLDIIPGLSELWGTITLIGFVHFSSLLYMKRWTLRTTEGDNKASTRTDTWLSRKLWTQMYKVALSPRFVGIPYESAMLEQGKSSQVRSTAMHGTFSMNRVLWLLIKTGVNLHFNGLITSFLNPITINDFIPTRTEFLRRFLQSTGHHPSGLISTREITMRIWFAVNSIWTPMLLLDCIHTALAILFIYVIRIDTPEDWPDLFGNSLEAYTLGRFWTRYVRFWSCSLTHS